MAGQVIGMLLTVLLLWGGRDRVWTPTYEGDQWTRFERGILHYKTKMGLRDHLVFEYGVARTGRAAKERWCASVEQSWIAPRGGFEAQLVTRVIYYGAREKPCNRNRPELTALHESCHLRMMHHRGALGNDVMAKEAEVRACMTWYGAKERR